MNLYNTYLQISEQNNLTVSPKNFLRNPNSETSKKYIEKYYGNRGKETVFNFDIYDGNDIFEKSVHSVSAFLLGMALKNLIDKHFEDLLKFTFNNKDEFGFNYVWFLSCLYHDTTTTFEIKNTNMKNINEFISTNQIEFNLFNNTLEGINIPDFLPTYNENLIKNYFLMRIGSNRFDHGITAGYFLYDRLLKNYDNNWKPFVINQSGWTKGRFYTNLNGRNLIWRKEQLWIFKLVADAIISHNIWFSDKTSKEKYSEYDLQYLNDKKNRLNIRGNTLAFYLGVIDTIEPTKFFINNKPKHVMQNINIELQNKTITISQNGNAFDFSNWYKSKIKGLEIWLKVKTNFSGEIITIDIEGAF